MLVGSIIGMDPQAAQILSDSGMGCLGCPASQSETLADACLVHGLDVEEILKQLNAKARSRHRRNRTRSFNHYDRR